MSQTDDPTKGSKSLTIIDYKLTVLGKTEPSKDSYMFKIGPNSILKEFSFNMELSTLAQAQAMYQSQLNYDSIIKGGILDESVDIIVTALDVIQLSYPDTSPEELAGFITASINRKIKKWSTKDYSNIEQ